MHEHDLLFANPQRSQRPRNNTQNKKNTTLFSTHSRQAKQSIFTANFHSQYIRTSKPAHIFFLSHLTKRPNWKWFKQNEKKNPQRQRGELRKKNLGIKYITNTDKPISLFMLIFNLWAGLITYILGRWRVPHSSLHIFTTRWKLPPSNTHNTHKLNGRSI